MADRDHDVRNSLLFCVGFLAVFWWLASKFFLMLRGK